jgi:hypothetical protein
MPILNPAGLSFSCFPREMAVDVGFERSENDRWKRHSIAVTFQEQEPKELQEADVSQATQIKPVLKTRSKSAKSVTRPTSTVIPNDIPEEADLNSQLVQRECLISRKMSKSVQEKVTSSLRIQFLDKQFFETIVSTSKLYFADTTQA